MSLYLRIKAFIFFYFLCYFSTNGYAQNYKNEFGAVADNDVYISYMQDRYYTNGLMLYFRHAPKMSDKKKGDSLSNRYEKKILELEVGQKIYNPYSSNAPDSKLHDRPFTGYLYGGVTLGLFYANEDVIKVRARFGVMGPSSLARETQQTFHKLFHMHPVNGWEYQLREELNLNMQVMYDRLIYRGAKQHFDISGRSTLLLGNTKSGADVGIMLRFGRFNSFYQSSSYNSRISNKVDDVAALRVSRSTTKKELFFFTRPEINYVAYDATIQGPLFRHEKGPVTFASKKLVYSQQAGVEIAGNHWTGKYIITFLSKEVEGAARPSFYGSIGLSYSF